jgi:hypothetical protein
MNGRQEPGLRDAGRETEAFVRVLHRTAEVMGFRVEREDWLPAFSVLRFQARRQAVLLAGCGYLGHGCGWGLRYPVSDVGRPRRPASCEPVFHGGAGGSGGARVCGRNPVAVREAQHLDGDAVLLGVDAVLARNHFPAGSPCSGGLVKIGWEWPRRMQTPLPC